jgi:hypothetical protein
MFMKFFVLIISLFLFSEVIFSQNDSINLYLFENLVVVIEVEEELYKDLNNNLYKIKIDSVFNFYDNNVFKDKNDFLKVMFLETMKVSLKSGDKFIATICFGLNEHYVTLVRKFDYKKYIIIDYKNNRLHYFPSKDLVKGYRIPNWLDMLYQKKIISFKFYKRIYMQDRYSLKNKYLDIIKPNKTN